MQKLQQHTKAIFTVALAMVVLFSLSGLSVYSHYCSHSNNISHSLYIPVDECETEQTAQTVESCCEVVQTTCCENNLEKEDDCCSNDSEYLKLDVKTLVSNHISIAQELFDVTIQLIACNLEMIDQSSVPEPRPDNSEEPPPISTSQYLSHIQVYIL